MFNLETLVELNKPTFKVTLTNGKKLASQFQLITVEDESTIVLSEEFMKLANVQDNKLCVYFEPGDKQVYFTFHNSEVLPTDFLKGKRFVKKDEVSGEETVTYGKKTNRFKDDATKSGKTIKEMLELQYPNSNTVNKIKGEFKVFDFTTIQGYQEAGITSVWTLELTNFEVEKQDIGTIVESEPVNENKSNNIPYTNLSGEEQRLKRYEILEEMAEENEVEESNTTAESIANFEKSLSDSVELIKNETEETISNLKLSYTDRLSEELLETSPAFLEYQAQN